MGGGEGLETHYGLFKVKRNVFSNLVSLATVHLCILVMVKTRLTFYDMQLKKSNKTMKGRPYMWNIPFIIFIYFHNSYYPLYDNAA